MFEICDILCTLIVTYSFIISFETFLSDFLLIYFRIRAQPRRQDGRGQRAPRTTPSPSTALFSRTRFSGLSLRTTRSPLPRPTRGCRCSSPRRTGTCSRTGRGTPTSSTSRPRHTPSRPSPPRASSLQRSQTSGKKKEFTINLPKYNYCHNYHVSGRLLSEFS